MHTIIEYTMGGFSRPWVPKMTESGRRDVSSDKGPSTAYSPDDRMERHSIIIAVPFSNFVRLYVKQKEKDKRKKKTGLLLSIGCVAHKIYHEIREREI